MFNTPQKNRLTMIAERARAFNNYADCDVVENAVQAVERANKKHEAIEAIDYLICAMEYRRGEQAADDIKGLKHEFLAYESVLSAQHYQLTSAIEYFEREANKGTIIRLM